MGKANALIATGLLLSGIAIGWQVNGWRLGEQIAEQRAGHIDQLSLVAEANAAVIRQQQSKMQARVKYVAREICTRVGTGMLSSRLFEPKEKPGKGRAEG